MTTVAKQLLDILNSIKGNGSFCTFGLKNFTLPGLQIEGVGEIGFPINPLMVKEITKLAHKAPFGKGSQTIVDSSVRSAWEIDADQLNFNTENWENFIHETINKVKEGLGIQEQFISASLYKLLIYEEGGFFLPHKDSEKEKGMFGTMIIGLPSTHTGGELCINFEGRTEIIDFSEPTGNYKIPFAAFFADCEHEIKPITSGYRICLVYNLLQTEGSKKISSPQSALQVKQLTSLLKPMEDSMEDWPKAILLGHQYTPENFSLSHLKHHDRPRAEALIEAADKAGYFATLGLVTHYIQGELEGADYDDYYSRRNRYNRHEDNESTGGTMGDEIYDGYTQIEHWSDEATPGLGEISLLPKDILSNFTIGEGEPITQEEEGYTGNAGMTMQYWYHYAAIVFWPKSQHFNFLKNKNIGVKLDWLGYYFHHWEVPLLNAPKYAKQLIISFTEEEGRMPDSLDFSVIASVLIKIKDDSLVKEKCKFLLAATFSHIKVKNWIDLLKNYPPLNFIPIFNLATARGDVFTIKHLLEIFKASIALESPVLKDFIFQQTQEIPAYLRKVNFKRTEEKYYYSRSKKDSRKEILTAIIENILVLSQHKEEEEEVLKSILESITKALSREYVNEVLVPILMSKKYKKRILSSSLHKVCIQDLMDRTKTKPSPLPNWTRKVPKSKSYQEIWEILRPFLNSPTQQVFDYRKSQSYRSDMESAIMNVTIDLKKATIKSGSPHTLRLTKTQAAYELQLKKWEEDRKILKSLERLK